MCVVSKAEALTKKADKQPPWAAIPARAMGDKRLNAEHFRVLMVVAFHDRFGKNGAGCYAGHKRMATLAACDSKSLSRTMRQLAEWGYIRGRVNPLNKRTNIYNVLYEEPEIGSVPATDNLDLGSTTATNLLQTGSKSAPVELEIGSTDFDDVEQNQSVADGKISCETIINHSETDQIHSGEPARSPERKLSDSEMLARIERQFSSGKWNVHLLQNCVSIVEAIMERAEPASMEYGWSERLLAAMDIELHPAVDRFDDLPF